MNVTNVKKLVQHLNGLVLEEMAKNYLWKELLILWYIMKENAISMVDKMMIIIN